MRFLLASAAVYAAIFCSHSISLAQFPASQSSGKLSLEDLPQMDLTRPPVAKPVPVPASRSIRRPVAPVPIATMPSGSPALSGQARDAMAYYGSHGAMQTLQAMPRRPSSFTGSGGPLRPAAPRNKPFAANHHSPTLSPYLDLYREETIETTPNYHGFVRPRLQQRDTNLRQNSELQRLQRQVQSYSTGAALPQATAAGLPGTGHRARFLDTAQYYGGFSR